MYRTLTFLFLILTAASVRAADPATPIEAPSAGANGASNVEARNAPSDGALYLEAKKAFADGRGRPRDDAGERGP